MIFAAAFDAVVLTFSPRRRCAYFTFRVHDLLPLLFMPAIISPLRISF